MDATCEAGSAYTSGAPDITCVFAGVRVAYSGISFLGCVLFTAVFLLFFSFLAIVMSVYFLLMSLNVSFIGRFRLSFTSNYFDYFRHSVAISSTNIHNPLLCKVMINILLAIHFHNENIN